MMIDHDKSQPRHQYGKTGGADRGYDRDLTVVGGGSFGTALASLAAGNDKKVIMWVRRPEQAAEISEQHTNERYLPGHDLPGDLQATSDMERAVRASRTVIVAIPSKSFRAVTSMLGEYLTGDQVVVHSTKGLELNTHRRMSEILTEETCAKKIGALSGPNLAKEIMGGDPAGCLVASRFAEVRHSLQVIYGGSRFRLYSGHDVVGTEIAGAFKNIVALACGAAHGMGFGQNTVSLLITRGLSEMTRFGLTMGANVFTFGGLAGVGDLVATCTSPLSRNHKVGVRLGKGEPLAEILDSMTQVAEGVPTVAAVQQFAKQRHLNLPIVNGVHALVHEAMKPNDVMRLLMSIPVGQELAVLPHG
ncbi:MAG: NAD(P)-dependent glycerol-3-phosphate dehydrogenase [Deltaproteobacteria bacterium]|nr:NAD(P)-dependent glycerol-3-phosphate dehydrogenase [Deltaproteobacteria bacterium]